MTFVSRGRGVAPGLLAAALAAFSMFALVPARAAVVHAAVAANFTAPVKALAAKFHEQTGNTVELSIGSTGQLFAQIANGAPFDVFFSADQARAVKAEKEGLGVKGSRFTYAIGTLVLWSANPKLVDKSGAVLKGGKFAHLAIANPATAPYGAAAVQAMRALGVYAAIKPKLVIGQSVNQTYQFVVSGNAALGFVALSQVIGKDTGSRWIVPAKLHSPIRQDALLLKPGAHNKAAAAFLAFVKSPAARAIIRRYGYAVAAGK